MTVPQGDADVKVSRPWLWIHLASLGVVLAVLVFVGRGQWFFGDDWDYVVFRGFAHPQHGLFSPHNEHWSTLVVAYYRVIFNVFGLRTYWPYLLGVFAAHLVLVHGLWRLMLRARVDAALATGVALVLGLYGAGYENVLWAVQISYLGSLAVGVWLLLLLHDEPRRARVAVVAVGNVVSLMFSGFSVVMVAVVGLAALRRWGWRKAVAITAPAAVIYLAWLKWQGDQGLTGSNAQFHGGPRDIPRYVWGGISSALGAPLHQPRLGELVLVALLVVFVVRGWSWWQRSPELVALAVGAPVMFAVISQGRGAIQSPSSPRYLYVAAVMVFPLLAYAVSPLVRGSAPRSWLALGVCVALAASGFGLLRDAARVERDRELTLKGQVLGAVQLADTQPVVTDTPDFAGQGDMTVEKLQGLRRRGQLPDFTPNPRDQAYARLAMQINVASQGDEALNGAPQTTAVLPAQAVSAAAADGCSDVDLRGADLVVGRKSGVGGVAAFVLVPSNAGVVQAYVPYPGGRAGPRTFPVAAGARAVVRNLVDRSIELSLPAGVNHLCGIAWQTN